MLKKIRINSITIVSAIFIISVIIFLNEAINLYNTYGISSYRKAYISDEIWYVSSARNILYKIFHVSHIFTNDTSKEYYTIVFENKPNITEIINIMEDNNCIHLVENNYTGNYPGVVTIFLNNTSLVEKIRVGRGLNAIYVSVEPNQKDCNLKCFMNNLKRHNYVVVDTIPGWALPDVIGINNYFNLEHPPLGKYIIALSIIIFHDHPIAWRIPSVISTSLLFVFAYLITKELLSGIIKEEKAIILSIITPLMMFFDNIYHTVGILAMLDSFLAVFTLMGVYVFIKYPYQEKHCIILRTVLFSIAGLVKLSGLFVVLADLIEGFLVKGDILKKLRHGFGALLRYYIIFPLLLLLVSLPIIGYFGLNDWYKYSIEDAIKWHTSSKLISNTVSYSPLDWFLGKNSFTLWIDKETGKDVVAKGIPQIYSLSMVIGILTLPLYIRNSKLRRLFLSTISIIFFYIILYILGNKSLFSFYIIQFTPLLEIQVIVFIVLLFSRINRIRNNLKIIIRKNKL